MRQFNTLTGFLTSKSSNPTTNDTVEFQGYETIGDGGSGRWKHNGITGQTPSQSPAQLGDALLNDGNGNQWAIVITSIPLDVKALGAVPNTDATVSFKAALNATKSVTYGDDDYILINLEPNTNNTLSGTGALTNTTDQTWLIYINGVDGVNLDLGPCSSTGATLNNSNDVIRLSNADSCDIKCVITESSGGGVCGYNSANNRVHHCDINNVHDNGIFFANLGSDNNMIEFNVVDGTASQNGIFITASSNSSATVDHIYNNTIRGNVVRNAADTPIESGIQADNTKMYGNSVYQINNAGLLFRDSVDGDCFDNTVNKLLAASDESGIAVVRQNLAESLDNRTKVHDNIIKGYLADTNYFVQIQQSGVEVYENTLIRGSFVGDKFVTAADASQGSAVGIFGQCENTVIRDNITESVRLDVTPVAFTGARAIVRPSISKTNERYKVNNASSFNYEGALISKTVAQEVVFSSSDLLEWTNPSEGTFKVCRMEISLDSDRTTNGIFDLHADGTITAVVENNIFDDITGFVGWGIFYSGSLFRVQRREATIAAVGDFTVKLIFT